MMGLVPGLEPPLCWTGHPANQKHMRYRVLLILELLFDYITIKGMKSQENTSILKTVRLRTDSCGIW